MKAVGNGNANVFWEHNLSPNQKPSKDSETNQRKTFAQTKYQKRQYSNQHPDANFQNRLNQVQCIKNL